jgi:hypothetical protein
MNWIAVAISTVLVFVLGGPWYGPLFGKAWKKAAGIPADAKPGHPARVFGGAAACGLIAALTLGWVLGPEPDLATGLTTGALAGLGFSAATFGINYLFANRPLALLLIDGAYNIVLLAAMGAVFGLLG